MRVRAAEERDRLPMALLFAAVAEERTGIASEPPVDVEADLGMLVAKDWRRRGVGRALLEAAVAWAREREMRRLVLDVFARNAGAIALYRAFGFVEDGRTRQIPRASGESWEAIGMTLELG